MSTIHDCQIRSHGFSRPGFDGLLAFKMKFESPAGRKLASEPFKFGQCANGAFSTAPARFVFALMEHLGVSRFSEIVQHKVDLTLNDEGEVVEIRARNATTSPVNFAEQLRLSRTDAVQLERLSPMTGINAPKIETLYAVIEDLDFYLDPKFQFVLTARLEDESIVSSDPFDLSSAHMHGRQPNHSPGTAVARLLDHILAVSGQDDWRDFSYGDNPTVIRLALEDGMIRYIGHAKETYWCDLKLQARYWQGEGEILLAKAA